jgi:hypothetical protein
VVFRARPHRIKRQLERFDSERGVPASPLLQAFLRRELHRCGKRFQNAANGLDRSLLFNRPKDSHGWNFCHRLYHHLGLVSVLGRLWMMGQDILCEPCPHSLSSIMFLPPKSCQPKAQHFHTIDAQPNWHPNSQPPRHD